MSLTEETEYERMWRDFPQLGELLGSTRLADHWYGNSSAADNIFERHRRLLKIMALVKDQREFLGLQKGEVALRVKADLLRLSMALRSAVRDLEIAAKEIDTAAAKIEFGNDSGITVEHLGMLSHKDRSTLIAQEIVDSLNKSVMAQDQGAGDSTKKSP